MGSSCGQRQGGVGNEHSGGSPREFVPGLHWRPRLTRVPCWSGEWRRGLDFAPADTMLMPNAPQPSAFAFHLNSFESPNLSAKKQPKPTFECPNCGAAVRVGSAVCRECGSDANTGWQSDEEVDYQSLDLPEGYGNVDGGRVPEPPKSKAFVLVVLVVVAVFAWLALRR